MTVDELIARLQALSPDERKLPAAVVDYESYHPVEVGDVRVSDRQSWEKETPQRFVMIQRK